MAKQAYNITGSVYGLYDPTAVRSRVQLATHDTVEWPQITSRSTTEYDEPGTGSRAASNVTGSVYALGGITVGRMLLRRFRGHSLTAYALDRQGIAMESERYGSARMGGVPRIGHLVNADASASMGGVPRILIDWDPGVYRLGAAPRISIEEVYNTLARIGSTPRIEITPEVTADADARMGSIARIRAITASGGVGEDCLTGDGLNAIAGVPNFVY